MPRLIKNDNLSIDYFVITTDGEDYFLLAVSNNKWYDVAKLIKEELVYRPQGNVILSFGGTKNGKNA